MTEYLSFLRASLPWADLVSVDGAVLEQIARHAAAVRRETPWGASIPEDIFRSFVLFPRVNNEDLVFYHEIIWSQLKGHLAGLTMEQAVREVNFWCYEQATYQSTDGRTANALTVMRRGFGRCGEESTLLVSALRACGIPARQVYVPRWAHCDDNHAWVEAWADGKWRYLGACEPEPVLDSGWFTASASKAMLVSTRAYGMPRAGEIEFVNSTATYAQTRLFTVFVTENGAPRAGVTVRFELANMAEFYPIYQAKTDADGRVSLLTGLGTLHLHVHDGQRYLCRMADVAKDDGCTLDFAQAVAFDRSEHSFTQRPPQETRIQPSVFPPETLAAHRARMAACEAARRSRHAPVLHEENIYLRKAGLNGAEIRAFLNDPRFVMDDKTALLNSLRDKDFADATAAMLCDALETALPAKALLPESVWQESVLCPRVANEALYPVRVRLCAQTEPFRNARQVWQAVAERVSLCDAEPAALIPNLYAAWESARCGAVARDILFVALCRAHGIAARLNPANGEKEFWDGSGYTAIEPSRRADARLILRNASGTPLQYGVHFSIGVLRGGAFETLDLWGKTLENHLDLSVSAGQYRVITSRRQIDGAIDGRIFPAEIMPGGEAEIRLTLAPDATPEKLLHAPLPVYRSEQGGKTIALPPALHGSCAILAFIAPGEEPTEHFLNELLEARSALADANIAVRLLIHDDSLAENAKLQRVLSELPNAQLLFARDPETELAWRQLLRAGDLRLPFAIAVDKTGNGLFAFVNYNVGSVQALITMIRE